MCEDEAICGLPRLCGPRNYGAAFHATSHPTYHVLARYHPTIDGVSRKTLVA